jgi:lambda repressor-like predicted transcriptional regulator
MKEFTWGATVKARLYDLGRSVSALAKDAGYARTYLSALLSRGSVPQQAQRRVERVLEQWEREEAAGHVGA